jgi:SAM-dependent methyltransferase
MIQYFSVKAEDDASDFNHERTVMGMKLEHVVPWGRSLAEYICMFDLSPSDLQCHILDCGGGPASFNAELTHQGQAVISCDPIYQFSTEEIQRRIAETYFVLLAGVQANQQCYVWQDIQSPEQLGQVRMAAMQQFLADFPIGREQGRYVCEELPTLSFQSGQFDLALCSHLLFTYSDHLSLDVHLQSIRELCRVASEVRLFPVLDISGEVSPFLQPVMEQLSEQGYDICLKPVPYEFQKGGNQMLWVQS